MKFYIASIAATCCIALRGDATEYVDGPEALDVLLPEVAHAFGATFAVHRTLEDMKLQEKDVYVLPRPPNVQDCLSALSGVPLTRQPKPYSKTLSMLELQPYQEVRTKIAEARAAALSELLAPVASSMAMKTLSRIPNLLTVEYVPRQYGSWFFLIAQTLVYGVFVPAALIGLKYAKTTKYIKKTFTLIAFFLYYSAILILCQIILRFSTAISVLIGLAGGAFAMYYSLRSVGSVPLCVWLNERFGAWMEVDLQVPMGWYMCLKGASIISANLIYQLLSSLLPYRYGLAGLLTTSSIYGGLLYIAFLMLVGYQIRKRLNCPEGDPRVKHNIVLSLLCAYIAVAGLSYFSNLVAIYLGIIDLAPFDPVLFFTHVVVFDLNPTSILFTLIFFGAFGVGYHTHQEMDESNKTITNFTSLSNFTFDESSRALTETLSDLSLRVIDM